MCGTMCAYASSCHKAIGFPSPLKHGVFSYQRIKTPVSSLCEKGLATLEGMCRDVNRSDVIAEQANKRAKERKTEKKGREGGIRSLSITLNFMGDCQVLSCSLSTPLWGLELYVYHRPSGHFIGEYIQELSLLSFVKTQHFISKSFCLVCLLF